MPRAVHLWGPGFCSQSSIWIQRESLSLFWGTALPRPEKQDMDNDRASVFLPLGGPLCSCCVPDPMGLSFLPTYGCQSNRTASVAALRMKAREHSEAVLQSANLLPSTSSSPSPASKQAPPEGSQDKTSPTKEQSEGEKSV